MSENLALDLDQVILMLGDSSTRDLVPSKLHQFGELAVAPLLETLEHSSEEYRYGALWAIGRVHNSVLGAALAPLALEPCIALLNSDESPRVRMSALQTLMILASNADRGPVVNAFVRALKADQDQIRAEAARWLGQFADPKAIEPLHELLLNDPSELVRGRAANALAYL
jgi:HEAT repeat protein